MEKFDRVIKKKKNFWMMQKGLIVFWLNFSTILYTIFYIRIIEYYNNN